MTSPRRYPLAVGGRVRHMDGREGTIEREHVCERTGAPDMYLVIWEDRLQDWQLPGFLESVPSEFAP